MRLAMLLMGCATLAACGRPKAPESNAANGGRPAQAAAAPAESAAAPNAPAAPVSGQAVFGRTCVTCHQATGQGIPGAFPPLAGSPYANGPKQKMIRIALNGLTGPVTVEGKRFNGIMPPWKGQLSDAEIGAVLTYVRGAFGNHGDAVSAEDVRQERAATAARPGPWTIAELERGSR